MLHILLILLHSAVFQGSEQLALRAMLQRSFRLSMILLLSAFYPQKKKPPLFGGEIGGWIGIGVMLILLWLVRYEVFPLLHEIILYVS